MTSFRVLFIGQQVTNTTQFSLQHLPVASSMVGIGAIISVSSGLEWRGRITANKLNLRIGMMTLPKKGVVGFG